ncbi:MAG: hypothetical protein ABH851_08115 [Methanobacteriota archaeon]
MKVKRITPQRKLLAYRQGRVLEERINEGKVVDIAEKLGVSPATVSRDLAHIAEHTTDQWILDILENKAQIRQDRAWKLLKEGKSQREIADILCVSGWTVSSDIRKKERQVERERRK